MGAEVNTLMNWNQDKFLEKIKATIAGHSMLSGGETVLIGLSGGPDSVCLLHVLHRLREEFDLKLHALYIDHGLRPEETPAELEFCRTLCKGLAVPFASRVVDVKAYAKGHGMNKQEAARELRYRVFDEVLQETRAARIALGHTADDQVETFLMRFFRGSGPKGLSGIPPVRGEIIRPLIGTERREIEGFLDEHRISYIVDSSNLGQDYLRNRIRQVLMPELRKINPSLTMTVTRTMEILREEEQYFDLVVTKTLMRLISRKTEDRIELFLAPLETLDKVILRRVLRRAISETRGLRGLEFVHIEEIIGLARDGKPGDRVHLPKGLRAIRGYATLEITAEAPRRVASHQLPVPGEAVLKEVGAVVRASVYAEAGDLGDGKTVAVLDAGKTGAALVVRARDKGDFFYPLGFGKRKKLQDLFVDMKVPRDERDAVPIIFSGDDIVWVAGYRPDERFRVTGETRSFLRLELRKAF